MDDDEYEEYVEDREERVRAMMDHELFRGCDAGYE